MKQAWVFVDDYEKTCLCTGRCSLDVHFPRDESV